MINISVLQSDKPLKDNMHITALPLYKKITIPFENLHRLTTSDFRQYSSFNFLKGKKKSENWSNEGQNILILDIDDGLTIEEAKIKFSKYKYFLCTTKSHQVEKKGLKCDRFRIILKAKNVPHNDSYFDYMEQLEKLYPFIDKQVNCKIGAFLGYSKAIYFYNDGIEFDFDILKPIELPKPYEEPRQINEDNNMEAQELKQNLSRERIADILNMNGFDVDRNFKLKLREERTPSTSISINGLIKDFGTDFAGDIFSVLMEYRNMTFPQAIEEVRKYV